MVGAFLLAGAALGSGNAMAEYWQDGRQVYDKVCSHCHEHGVGPTIKGRQLPAEYVQRVVRFGNRAMPSFRPSEIDPATLADLARVINGSTTVASRTEQ